MDWTKIVHDFLVNIVSADGLAFPPDYTKRKFLLPLNL